MFEYDEVPGATSYIISIFPPDDRQPFLMEVKNRSLACIVSNLEFGHSYKWHYEAYKKKKLIFKSRDYTFSIRSYYLIDTSLFRSKIEISKKVALNNDLIFLDYPGIAINRQGTPVWFYPFVSPNGMSAPNFRNMRMTNDGNITFQDNTDCYEVNIKGELLWKAPNDGKVSGSATEFYHHDFRKLDDGTYLTSSYKFVSEANYYNPSIISKVRYNTLVQYDASGKVVWYWNEKDHIAKSFIFQGYAADATDVEGTHLNGFDYSAEEDAIVMSFRNNSNIIKIDKKTGNVIYNLAEYGDQSGKQKDPWFARQHGPVILPGHRLLVYNNNVKDTITGGSYPKVLIIKEPLNGNNASIAWEYECRSIRFPKGIIGKEGYAAPLPNGDILVCMGGANYSFEVTPAKEVVWQSSFEKYDDKQKTWTGFNNYRCSYASSLYPKYFTLQRSKEKNKEQGKIKINNEGTENDSFLVELVLADGITKVFADTARLRGRSSGIIKLPVKTAMKQNKGKNNLIVLVTSLSNRFLSKIFNLEFGDKK